MSRNPRQDLARKRRLRRRNEAWVGKQAVCLRLWSELKCPECEGRGCSWPWGGYHECERCGGQCYDARHPLAPKAQAIARVLGLHWPELWL